MILDLLSSLSLNYASSSSSSHYYYYHFIMFITMFRFLLRTSAQLMSCSIPVRFRPATLKVLQASGLDCIPELLRIAFSKWQSEDVGSASCTSGSFMAVTIVGL